MTSNLPSTEAGEKIVDVEVKIIESNVITFQIIQHATNLKVTHFVSIENQKIFMNTICTRNRKVCLNEKSVSRYAYLISLIMGIHLLFCLYVRLQVCLLGDLS